MKRRSLLFLFLALFLAAIFAGCAANPIEVVPSGPGQGDTVPAELRVHFIDVGQGDSILIQTPSKQTILVDGGPTAASETVLGYLQAAGVTAIDHLIATHPHEDHVGGLVRVLEQLAVTRVYLPRAEHASKTYENLLLAIKEKGLKITAAAANLELDCGPGLSAVFVAPNSESYDHLNDYSAVLKVTFGNAAFLFTGDAETVSEQEMLSAKASIKADVLKVGHHGSETSTSRPFLAAVAPSIAVISVGADNSYGHPHRETLAALAGARVKVYRTDLDGSIVIVSDGKHITVQTSRKAPPEKENQPYIGNTNSKRFHLPSCNNLPAPQNRVFFQSRDQAIRAGYEPCQVCQP